MTKQPASFEQAMSRLETIIDRLEGGETELEESIRLYEEGVRLKTFCEKKLEDARLRIEKITAPPEGGAGKPSRAPFDPEGGSG